MNNKERSKFIVGIGPILFDAIERYQKGWLVKKGTVMVNVVVCLMFKDNPKFVDHLIDVPGKHVDDWSKADNFNVNVISGFLMRAILKYEEEHSS